MRAAIVTMAKKKSRIINVRLISMAMTGFFYNFKRPRAATPMGMLKYDPIGAFTCPWRLPWLGVPRNPI